MPALVEQLGRDCLSSLLFNVSLASSFLYITINNKLKKHSYYNWIDRLRLNCVVNIPWTVFFMTCRPVQVIMLRRYTKEFLSDVKAFKESWIRNSYDTNLKWHVVLCRSTHPVCSLEVHHDEHWMWHAWCLHYTWQQGRRRQWRGRVYKIHSLPVCSRCHRLSLQTVWVCT